MNEEKGRYQNRLTHAQFYQACEGLKTHRDKFTKERPNLKQASVILSGLTKLSISPGAMNEIKEQTGINWEPIMVRPKNDVRKWQTRTLTNAVYQLYKELGISVPIALDNLFEAYKNEPIESKE